jgi:hypothetical protein
MSTILTNFRQKFSKWTIKTPKTHNLIQKAAKLRNCMDFKWWKNRIKCTSQRKKVKKTKTAPTKDFINRLRGNKNYKTKLPIHIFWVGSSSKIRMSLIHRILVLSQILMQANNTHQATPEHHIAETTAIAAEIYHSPIPLILIMTVVHSIQLRKFQLLKFLKKCSRNLSRYRLYRTKSQRVNMRWAKRRSKSPQ